MALAHRRYPTFGLQFHPESILTTAGRQLLENFLAKGGHNGD
jgi:anthranilate/para-aminobenzoate synthase component II